MNYPRHSHGICYLAGEVYVVGGVTAKEYSTGKTERFNLETKMWQSLPACNFNRLNPKLCGSFNSKMLYVFGGVPDNVEANKGVEMFDTQTLDWRPLQVELPIEFKGNRLHFCMMIEGKFYLPPITT